jgi:hypothetical protein
VSFILAFLAYACSSSSSAAQSSPAAASCQLDPANGKIKHVISVVFDNVHFTRDNPNVPSDLELMPHLLNFLRQNGTFESNHHAVLISHTADDILTELTGVYGDRHGIPIANSYGVFRPNGTVVPSVSSFFYWTDLVSDVSASTGDSTFGMLTENGKNAPAPWVPFARAGCDFGAYSTANIVLERTPFDVVKIFGPCTTLNPKPQLARITTIKMQISLELPCTAHRAARFAPIRMERLRIFFPRSRAGTLTVALADPVEMGLLHMITADPKRTPSFTMFGDAD